MLERVTVLAGIMRSREVARAAVVGLTIGLSALAALSLWGTASTAQTTIWVRHVDQVGDQWGKFFLNVSVEYETLTNYLRADSDVGRQPLVSAIGSAEPNLRWLQAHGGPVEADAATSVLDTYRSHTETLRELVDAGSRGDRAEVAILADQAALSASSLRKQSMANVVRKRLEMSVYLTQVDARNRELRLAAGVIFTVDFLLLGLSGFVLFTHQRRIEGQAVESRHQALHDSLTGVANRVLLADRVELALRAASRHNETVGLLLLDLNRFKEINDTLGHRYGDLLLGQVASRLIGLVRDCDTVARLGGDEFAVLLPQVSSAPHAMEIADRVVAGLQLPATLDGIIVDVSVSIGVAIYPMHSESSTELLQHADIAMYTAKRGHLGTAMYDPDANQHSAAELALLGELRHAIDVGQLVLHYQPKVSTATARACGVEALVRWQHPGHGLLPPDRFIPLAEQSHLIHPLTDYVLAEALRQHRQWQRNGLLLPVAVNVATRCLLNPAFPDRIAALLAEHATMPDHLILEITESALITDRERATAVLRQLRDIGVRLSIDDFGTGYSSMGYLQTMPLNELKIDRCFVTAMRSSRSSEAIIRAILELAHALDLEVVAEGVEDEATWTALRGMGCDVGQGYHLCRPIPAAAITAWFTRQVDPVEATAA